MKQKFLFMSRIVIRQQTEMAIQQQNQSHCFPVSFQFTIHQKGRMLNKPKASCLLKKKKLYKKLYVHTLHKQEGAKRRKNDHFFYSQINHNMMKCNDDKVKRKEKQKTSERR